MWIDTRANENDQSARATAYADIPVRNEVNKQLRNFGWQEVTENPDVLVSYEVLVERSRETRSDPIYSQAFTRSYYNPYTRRWSTMYYPSQFQGYQVYDTPVRDGTVTITLVDSKTDKNIWQGWSTERLSGTRLSSEQVEGTVQRIFAKINNSMSGFAYPNKMPEASPRIGSCRIHNALQMVSKIIVQDEHFQPSGVG